MKIRAYRYIDALRGLAILGVVAVHCRQVGSSEGLPSWMVSTVDFGARGVQLFFVVSALTLFMSMNARKKLGGETPGDFFIRRFFRIAPLYYLGIVLYLSVYGFGPRYWLGDAPGVSWMNIAANFLFIHQLSPYWINSVVPGGWSLSVEASFYLLLPLLFATITSLTRAVLFFALSVVVSISMYTWLATPPIGDSELWGNYLRLYLPAQLPVFALGILLFYLTAEDSRDSRKPTRLWPMLVPFLAFCLNWGDCRATLALLCGFACLILLMSQKRLRLLENQFTVFLGTVSYGVYICHFAVLEAMASAGVTDLITPSSPFRAVLNYSCRFLILLLGASTVSYLLHRMVELPGQRLGHGIIEMRNCRKRFALPNAT